VVTAVHSRAGSGVPGVAWRTAAERRAGALAARVGLWAGAAARCPCGARDECGGGGGGRATGSSAAARRWSRVTRDTGRERLAGVSRPRRDKEDAGERHDPAGEPCLKL